MGFEVGSLEGRQARWPLFHHHGPRGLNKCFWAISWIKALSYDVQSHVTMYFYPITAHYFWVESIANLFFNLVIPLTTTDINGFTIFFSKRKIKIVRFWSDPTHPPPTKSIHNKIQLFDGVKIWLIPSRLVGARPWWWWWWRFDFGGRSCRKHSLKKRHLAWSKMDQTRPLFVYFCSFHMTNIAQTL